MIQAKRYRGTVPVAAVRELYGTMINGAHLLHLLQNHGHRLRIDLSEGVEDAVLDNAPV